MHARPLDPTPRDVRIFALLWALFFAALAFVVGWRPEAFRVAATFLGCAWILSLLFNGEDRSAQWIGGLLPLGFGLLALASASGLPPRIVQGVLAAIGAAGAVAAWGLPAFGRRLWLGWMAMGAPIGWAVSHVVLAGVYYGVLTPIGWGMRLLGRDPLDRAIRAEATSYWIEREGEPDPERYLRQF